jgi:hypothetical protein
MPTYATATNEWTISPIHLLTYAPFITSQTDKPTYSSNSNNVTISNNSTLVTISGMIDQDIVPTASPEFPDVKAPKFVSIWIFNPDGKTLLHDYSNLTLLPDAINYSTAYYIYNYSYTFDLLNTTLINGQLLKDGDYEAVAIYNKGWQSFSSFSYNDENADVGTNSTASNHYFVMIVNDTQTFPIRYSEVGGAKITAIGLDSRYPIMYITMESTKENNSLTVELPRYIIDARADNGTDKSYAVADSSGGGAVIVDNFPEIQSSDHNFRVLKFDLPSAGTHSKLIYGTQVMPEFGSLVSLAIMAGVLSIVIMMARVRR